MISMYFTIAPPFAGIVPCRAPFRYLVRSRRAILDMAGRFFYDRDSSRSPRVRMSSALAV
jgi:hypothetical protein